MFIAWEILGQAAEKLEGKDGEVIQKTCYFLRRENS